MRLSGNQVCIVKSKLSKYMKKFQENYFLNKLIYFLLPLILYLINWVTDWPLLRISNLAAGFNFADLFSTLSTGDCYEKIGLQVYAPTNPGYCGRYIYGVDLLRFLDITNISANFSNTIGILFIIFFGIIIGHFFNKVSSTKKVNPLILLLILVSPGVSLLLERGNIDLLIFIGIYVMSRLIEKESYHWAVLIGVILSIVKFYPFPLLLILVIYFWRNKNTWLKIVLLSITTFEIFASVTRIKTGFPEGGYAQFGMNIIGNYLRGLNLEVSHLGGRILGFSITLLAVYALKKSSLSDSIEISKVSHNWIDIFALQCGFIFITCYFLGLSYDYRLVYLLVYSSWLVSKVLTNRRQRNLVTLLAIFAAWFSISLGSGLFEKNFFWQHYVVNGIQAIGDIAIWIIVCLTIAKMDFCKANFYRKVV